MNLFISYGQNVLVERQSQDKDTGTISGKVIHSSMGDLKFGDIILYAEHDAIKIKIQEGKTVDCIWSARIRAKMITKPDVKKED